MNRYAANPKEGTILMDREVLWGLSSGITHMRAKQRAGTIGKNQPPPLSSKPPRRRLVIGRLPCPRLPIGQSLTADTRPGAPQHIALGKRFFASLGARGVRSHRGPLQVGQAQECDAISQWLGVFDFLMLHSCPPPRPQPYPAEKHVRRRINESLAFLPTPPPQGFTAYVRM